MIAYFLTYDYDERGKCHGAKAHRYDGTITFLAGVTTVLLGGHSNFQRRNKVTVFDDSHQPPKLIREDYPMKKLRKFKYLDLPTTYINERNDIVNLRGEVLMQGPSSRP